MKVLVVDDSGVMRKMVIRELLKMNVTEAMIDQAEDGEQGLQKALIGNYDLILMDWNMPAMLGIDALKGMRQNGVTSKVIMVTTEAERSQVLLAIQSGANNYLRKPFTSEDFSEKVTATMGGPEAWSNLVGATPTTHG